MKILDWLYSAIIEYFTRLEQSFIPEIKVGDTWIEKTDNPFEHSEIKILDFKQKYVLFYFTVIDGNKISSERHHSITESYMRKKYKPKM